MALAVALDQYTKSLVRDRVEVGEVIDVIPGLSIHHVQNYGVAFGLFHGAGALLPVLTIIVAAAMALFLYRSADTGTFAAVGGIAIVSGAVGNLIDRIRLGYVTDFLHIPHWPTFNAADCFVVGGVAVVAVSTLFTPTRQDADGSNS